MAHFRLARRTFFVPRERQQGEKAVFLGALLVRQFFPATETGSHTQTDIYRIYVNLKLRMVNNQYLHLISVITFVFSSVSSNRSRISPWKSNRMISKTPWKCRNCSARLQFFFPFFFLTYSEVKNKVTWQVIELKKLWHAVTKSMPLTYCL